MIDAIIPFDIFQNVILDFCNSTEQLLLKQIFYDEKLEITNLLGIENLTDEMLKKYPKVKYLDCTNNAITDKGIKYTNLKSLIIYNNSKITDDGIKHMTDLEELYIHDNKKISDKGIKKMDLKILDASFTNISNEGIKHMHLEVLYANCNSNITDEGIKHMDLKILYAYGNHNITKKGIRHMTDCKFFQ